MKLLKIDYYYNGRAVLDIYKKLLKSYIKYYSETKSIIELKKMFTEDEINETISNIYYSGGYIETSGDDKIIRFLEYGGPNIKALNIISKINNSFSGGYND